MEYIKTFENFEQVDESLLPGGGKNTLGSVVSTLLKLPLIVITIGLSNLSSPRNIDKITSQKYLTGYSNLDKIKKAVETLLKDDLTGAEIKKANKTLDEIERIMKKYPTLEDYKTMLKKYIPILNIKEKEFIKRKIDEYKHKDISFDELHNLIKHINKEKSVDPAFDNASKK